MCGRHSMHLLMIAVVCGSAMSCRPDTRADDEAAIRAATREWNAAEAAKDLEKNGQATTTNGKYVCVWKKQQDGKWKVVADIDNPDS
jgi:ketosteroid isomerase-like protein